MLSNLTIKSRISIVGLVSVLGVIALGATFFYSSSKQSFATNRKAHLNEVLSKLEALNFDLLNARYTEKEFILQAKEKYVKSQAALKKLTFNVLDTIRPQLQDDNEVKAVAIIADGVTNYFKHWDSVVAENRKYGFVKDEGYLGAARTGSKNLAKVFISQTANVASDKVLPMRVVLDKMRRGEMELLARRDPKYIQDVSKLSSTFAGLVKSAGLLPDVQTALLAANQMYISSFLAMGNQNVLISTESGKFKFFYRPAKASLDMLIKQIHQEGVDADAMLKSVRTSMKMLTSLILILIIGAVSALVFVIGRGISTPISSMTNAMNALSKGDLNTEIPNMENKDEIGDMALAVQVFKENMADNAKMTAKSKRENEKREQRVQKIDTLTQSFDAITSEMLQAVLVSADQMVTTAHSMTTTTNEATDQSNDIVMAAEEATDKVQMVTTASANLSNSISDIANQVRQSSQIAANAVTEVESTNENVQGLAVAADKIGEVVSLITDIADQTNLLALNATIEAARAGDAGKGFAVVASEVKNLANQTARATEEISSQISGIQTATQGAVAAIQGIGSTINKINDISEAISTSIAEQGNATQDIARNVEMAADGTTHVSGSLVGVKQMISKTGEAASDVLVAADALKEKENALQKHIGSFLADIKNA